MSNLAARLAKLEAARQQSTTADAVPVFFVTMSTPGDQDRAMEVVRNGMTWVQGTDESNDAFKARVTAEALNAFKPCDPLQPLLLCASRPQRASRLGDAGFEAKCGAA